VDFVMTFRERLTRQEKLYGVMVTLGLGSVSEILSHCGFDWLWIDMEHAPLSLQDVQAMAQAKKPGCAALVRVPSHGEEWIPRVLDLGVDGLIIPHVNTAEEAARAVSASYYPPQGHRSVGPSRSSLYGLDAAYQLEANQKRLLFVQIEHRDGVKNIASILQVPGLDGVIIGPYDLSGSYGKLGQIQDSEVVAAIGDVLQACQQARMPVGIFSKPGPEAKLYVEQGFQLLAAGIDVHYLWNAAQEGLKSVKIGCVAEEVCEPAS
jgi:2-dehydro-3-deoxyglucarate aldolase/4-hydroxy-2-oxoheptanedioate aldolase